ncbi:MAG: hypothetical protein ABIQ12_12090, partial [Opitutaceae bacterium]
GAPRVDAGLLYATVTGDPGAVDNFPLNGVRWHTSPREIAVRVAQNRRDRFTADLFHFGAAARPLDASLLTLDPGDYTWTISSADDHPLSRGRVTLTSDHRRVSLVVPSRALCRLRIERAP